MYVYVVKSRVYRVYNEAQYDNLVSSAEAIGFDIKKEEYLTKITLTGTKEQFKKLKKMMA